MSKTTARSQIGRPHRWRVRPSCAEGPGNRSTAPSRQRRPEKPGRYSTSVRASGRKGGPEKYSDRADQIGDRGDQSGLEITEAEILDNRWQPKAQGITGSGSTKVDDAKHEHARVRQRLPQGVFSMGLPDHPLAAQAVDQPAALIGLEPDRLIGTIGKIEHHDKTEQNRRQALADKQPFPAPEPPNPVHAKDQPGYRRADDRRNRDRGHEAANHASAILCREPVGQEQNDSGKEAGFGR